MSSSWSVLLSCSIFLFPFVIFLFYLPTLSMVISSYWEETRRHRNNVAKIRKSSMRIYFEKNCKTHDKQFWRTISPFMSDKKFRNGGNIILNENGETKTDAAEVSEIFNEFFISTASEIGHNEDIASVPQAIDEYANHPSVMMIKRHYDNVIENFDFHSVDANDVMIILKNINPTKGMISYPENSFE